MPRLHIELRHTEHELLDELTGEDKPQPLIRALISMLAADETLRERALALAEQGERLPPTADHMPGRSKGLTAEDYREAISDQGSLRGAADALGVHRSTVREMAQAHDIPVASLGGVPE